jgi:uncharacterized repeat protein (TIGR02543 family)
MKRTFKIIGIIALLAAIAFSMAACYDDDGTNEDVTVTFNANGGKWDDGSTTKSAKVRHGTSWSQAKIYVQNPTRQGYTFWEWTGYANPDPNIIYNNNIIKDCTLYARWK